MPVHIKAARNMDFNGWVKLNVITSFLTSSVLCSMQPPINSAMLSTSKIIGECQSCKLFIESFKKGLERTARGKYEGGDAAWEEEKLKMSYKRSEIRLVDIQESICKDKTTYANQCHHMANKAEEFIEEWWAQDPDESEDLYSYICIEKLKFCCPKLHYGKDCRPCYSDHDNLCSGNGKCRGDGTRKGNGTCLCDDGYTGVSCDQCSNGYFLSYKDDNKMLCSECHKACSGGCRGGSQKDCVACRNGFQFSEENGCVDINECNDLKRCKHNQYCLNSLGSFACRDCDLACKSCYGHGPEMCRKCATGYIKQDEVCLSDRMVDDNAEMLTAVRYFGYIGMLISTAIVLPVSLTIGSIVGMTVFGYILCAEYYCMINGHIGLVNLTNYDLFTLIFRH